MAALGRLLLIVQLAVWQSTTAVVDVTIGLLFMDSLEERAYLGDKIGFAASAGAVPLALERVQREQLLPGVNISIYWRFSQCDESVAAGVTLELFSGRSVDVIIGPPCSMPAEMVGVMTNYFNVPQFSWAATSVPLDEVSRYPTVTRVISSAVRMGRALMELMRYFDWTRVALFYTDDLGSRKCLSMAMGVFKFFPVNDIHVVHTFEVPRETPTDDEIDAFLDIFPELTRIVIICIDLDEDIRRFMLRAQERGASGDEFVFVAPDFVRSENQTDIWLDRTAGSLSRARNNESLRSMQSVVFFEMKLAANSDLFVFKKRVMEKVAGWPFYHKAEHTELSYGSLYSPFLHDAVYLYALALNKTLMEGGNITDGLWITSNARNLRFQGASGDVVIDDTSSREPSFVLKGFRSDGKLTELLEARMHSQALKMIIPLVPEYAMWETRGGYAPKWYPRCGWTGDLCESDVQSWLAYLIVGTVLVVVVTFSLIIGGIVYYRRKILSDEMAKMLWKIDPKALDRLVTMQHEGSLSTITTEVSDDIAAIVLRGEDRVAHYRGLLVWLKTHHASMVLSSKADHMQLKTLRDMTHDNLNRFVGLCLDGAMVSVWGYCGKGSLQDILLNPSLKLDWFFKFALIRDMANGLEYMHESDLKSHGHLKSTNCVINARWVLMLTDFGLPSLRASQDIPIESRLWSAPELLRMENPPGSGTLPGDVYSFAIILQEVLTRDTPFGSFKKSPQEIVNLVRAGLDPPFRPDVANQNDADMDPGMVTLMRDCWHENPTNRPDMKHVKVAVKQLNRGGESNLLDHAMKMVEKYASGLETTATDRTKLLVEESGKADVLLYRLLPRKVADRLKAGQSVPPESLENVAVLFTDIHHFDKITAASTPLQTVNFLNDIYYLMDEVITEYDAFTVQNANDEYVIACGLQSCVGGGSAATVGTAGSANKTREHIGTAADLALHLQLRLTTYYIAHLPKEKCCLRVGIDAGPAIGGVIGTAVPRYCLFGETVMTAQSLLQEAKPLTIHISENVNTLLIDIIGGYISKPRGELQLKTTGVIFTFWLLGKTSKKIEDRTQSTTSGDSSSKSHN